VAPFRPGPLIQVLGSRGFTHTEEDLGGGAWAVTFRRVADRGAGADAAATDTRPWPEPVRHFDNRDLDPPEPMVRILAAIEEMAAGEVLSALLPREPSFLLPELAKRGHAWRGAMEEGGMVYRLLVRIGAGPEMRT
jgi:TusA-related sulfurtransferase